MNRAKLDLGELPTEAVNPRTVNVDRMPLPAMVRTLQREDAAVAAAVRRCTSAIAQATQKIAARFGAGGRLIYIGAGTSGRLGVLDAAECPPTFGIGRGRVIGVVAGGKLALTRSVEGAEDKPQLARQDLKKLRLTPLDSVVGIAASGRTPYTVEALKAARQYGCLTVAVTNVPDSALAHHADVVIEAVTGPEVIAGSTRMKAGSAQKMILNLLSTALMIHMGRIHGNLMTHMQPTNSKLRARAARIRQTVGNGS